MPAAAPERAQLEEHRLDSIGEYIGYLAFTFSRDNPDLEEDIAQEAREAVIKKLRRDPDCHISHLKVKAKSAILNYRRRGRSVDGKLNETGRQRHYNFLDIDKVVTEEEGTLADTLTEHQLPRRITEERALIRALIDQLRSQLSTEESQALNLRLWELSWREIAGRFDGQTSAIRGRIETVAREVLAPFTEEQANGYKDCP